MKGIKWIVRANGWEVYYFERSRGERWCTTPKILPIKKRCLLVEMNLVPMHVESKKGLSKVPKAFPLHFDASSWVQSVCGNSITKSDGCHCNHHRKSMISMQTYFLQEKEVLQAMRLVSRVRYMLVVAYLKIKRVCYRAHFSTIHVWMCWYFFPSVFSLVAFFVCFAVWQGHINGLECVLSSVTWCIYYITLYKGD